jgi:hypothetical protein
MRRTLTEREREEHLRIKHLVARRAPTGDPARARAAADARARRG